MAFVELVRSRARDVLAIGAALTGTDMLRVAALVDALPATTYLLAGLEPFANWTLLCAVSVATISACETVVEAGWRRTLAIAGSLAAAIPAYAAVVGTSPLLTVRVSALGLDDTEALFLHIVWLGWAVSALLSWYYGALGAAARTGTSLQKAQLDRQQAERRLIESRLAVLEAQVEPCFLLETLSRVQDLHARDPGRALGALDDFIDYLRAALPQLREQPSTLGREFALVRAYLRIVSTRPAHVATLDPDLEGAYAPPMVVLPAVQMALAAERGCIVAEGLRLVASSNGTRASIHAAFCVPDHWNPTGEEHVLVERLGLLFGEAARFTIARTPGRADLTASWPLPDAIGASPIRSTPHVEDSWNSLRPSDAT